MTDQTTPASLPALEGCVVELDEDMAQDQVIHIYNAVQFAKQRMREIDKTLKEALIEWINRNGDLTIGDQRFYVGNTKKTVCIDKMKTLDELLKASGGDLTGIARDVLSANAFKHGAARGVLPAEVWDECFVVEPVVDVKTGKAKKEVKQLDTRFTK